MQSRTPHRKTTRDTKKVGRSSRRTERPLAPDKFDRKDDILCITVSNWDGPKRVRHNIMREYARRGHRVLFVEASLSWVKLLKGLSHWKYVPLIVRKPRQTPDNVWVATMPPFIPGGEWSRAIALLNWWFVRVWLKTFVFRHIPLRHPRLFVFAPQAGSLVGTMGECLSVYYCNDPFAAIFEYPSARRTMQAMEDELTTRVDAVFTVSEQLRDERIRYNPKTFVIPLAVDVDLFSQALDKRMSIPEDIRDIPKPIVGYVGVINNRVDIDLMRYLAKKMRDLSFAFVGPVTEVGNTYKVELLSLQEEPNIYFLGDKPESSLPGYLRSFSVCLIPYVRNDVTKYIKANAKFFQYVASGRPVVSTIGPVGFSRTIVLSSDSYQDFVEGIRKALRLHSPRHYGERLKLAKHNSWASRVDLIEQILRQDVNTKP